ncbi:hypothetical protein BCR34DRAFT_591920 [Clohesyomyces aquaticus]|uniref:Uncharacterized protein n=1 Tax=Clohesyomyces aquaticus TaxID=1231657 RepID=A0A1Y1YX83_9PLEO|nr:hypothetical protein BCR34DRAFT_591920 [Clohesyomyces aquaticus]
MTGPRRMYSASRIAVWTYTGTLCEAVPSAKSRDERQKLVLEAGQPSDPITRYLCNGRKLGRGKGPTSQSAANPNPQTDRTCRRPSSGRKKRIRVSWHIMTVGLVLRQEYRERIIIFDQGASSLVGGLSRLPVPSSSPQEQEVPWKLHGGKS